WAREGNVDRYGFGLQRHDNYPCDFRCLVLLIQRSSSRFSSSLSCALFTFWRESRRTPGSQQASSVTLPKERDHERNDPANRFAFRCNRSREYGSWRATGSRHWITRLSQWCWWRRVRARVARRITLFQVRRLHCAHAARARWRTG